MSELVVREAVVADVPSMRTRFVLNGWRKPHGYFEGLLAHAEAGELCVAIAVDGDDYVGHIVIAWTSEYRGFRDAGVPELQDLAVVPDYRRAGVGSRLLDWAEARIAEVGPVAGIGVGLYADYGPAQQMYARRGYIPDGAGLHSGAAPVEPGGRVRVDDALVLYLLKTLR